MQQDGPWGDPQDDGIPVIGAEPVLSPAAESTARFAVERASFHAGRRDTILTVDSEGVASNADRWEQDKPAACARGCQPAGPHCTSPAGRRSDGGQYVRGAVGQLRAYYLSHARTSPTGVVVGRAHLAAQQARHRRVRPVCAPRVLDQAAARDPELAAALGNDYTITPDVILARNPELDAVINARGRLVDGSVATCAALRSDPHPDRQPMPVLHASLSCKWTHRSDRAQNARAEALNLIRNRKGGLPHVAVITAEPLPSRLASIALGTGDIDCVYHFALYELQAAVSQLGLDESAEMLAVIVDGARLKDLSDLPLDLAV